MEKGTEIMKIESPRFGVLEVEASKVIEFPAGIAGFEDCRRFTLFHPEGEKPKYFILQSLDNVELALYVTDPGPLGFNYELQLSAEEMQMLQISDVKQAAVLVILSKRQGDEGVQANLKAPLVINPQAQRGLQHVFNELRYDVGSESPGDAAKK